MGKEYTYIQEPKDFLKCMVEKCKEVMEEPIECGECGKNCCKKCCKNQIFCPFGCDFEEMHLNSAKLKKISNLMVKCSYCQKEMKKR